jgi:dTDP-4-dehydrorhamnose reductase
MDIADAASVAARLDVERPWAVVNAAGYVRVDDAEDDRERCWRENVVGPTALAAACRDRGIAFVTFSSDLVFNGRACRPYRESAPVDPLGVYGASKAAAERAVIEALPSALVVRTSAFFGPWDDYNFAWTTVAALRAGRAVRAADDLVVSPTYVPDLVDATLDLLIDGERGVWHLANEGAVSWAELARRVAVAGDLDPSLVEACPAADFGWPASRPAFSALGSERGPLLRPVEEALARFFRERVA